MNKLLFLFITLSPIYSSGRVIERPVSSLEDVQLICSIHVSNPEQLQFTGCFYQGKNTIFNIVYMIGDNCTRRHELRHYTDGDWHPNNYYHEQDCYEQRIHTGLWLNK